MDGRFIRATRRVAYENPWITVWHDEVTRPDGNPGIYGVVHFANVAVGVVAIDDDDRLVLVGQHRYTLDRDSWEIPEGGVPADEDPLVGAQRELREETGLTATTWRELCRLELSNSVTDETAVLFIATGLTHGASDPEPTESRWTAAHDHGRGDWDVIVVGLGALASAAAYWAACRLGAASTTVSPELEALGAAASWCSGSIPMSGRCASPGQPGRPGQPGG